MYPPAISIVNVVQYKNASIQLLSCESGNFHTKAVMCPPQINTYAVVEDTKEDKGSTMMHATAVGKRHVSGSRVN